ncbi:DIE2/ALG10 family domain-containing protein [Ditylenchus destructor]|nr:DIE2/ALG10 family domain-containing protein [Ditylenchus destructor]
MDIEWLVGICAGVLHSVFVRFLYHKIPEPYMDEEFHVNQTRTYCSGEFYSWNPKITTPPAVYVLALPFFCGSERYFNSALLPICFVGLCRLRRKWLHASSRTDCLLSALITISLPVLLDTSFLFYTDLLSLTCVVWGFNTSCPIISALIFAIGVLTRQTNIMWAAMYCFMAWIKNLDKKKPISSTLKCVWKHFAFVILAGAFTAFIVWNKGIVLGDKTAHQPVFHNIPKSVTVDCIYCSYIVFYSFLHTCPSLFIG